MSLHFHRVALVGKYQDAASGSAPESTRQVIADIAGFLVEQGCEVALAERTAASTGLHQYPVLDVARMRGLVMRRLISMIRPIRQRMPKIPPDTIASNCLFSVLIT